MNVSYKTSLQDIQEQRGKDLEDTKPINHFAQGLDVLQVDNTAAVFEMR